MIKNRGRFIVIEGVDGAGKTTQIQRLAESLREQGKEVFVTSEPTCKAAEHSPSAVGGLIARVLKGEVEMTASAMAALFLSDRILHNTDKDIGIRAQLSRGAYVICDRYYYSSFAYQGLDTDLEWVMNANLGCPDIERPDICIFLDLLPQTASERRQARGEEAEIFERPEVKTSSVRDKFLSVFSLLPEDNIRYVNADGTIDEVAQRVLCAVSDIL
ncbi:MAG: dTMP kinase [Clostridia bacterium]|nr:dTMP kinase [Clostridia bacterium]